MGRGLRIGHAAGNAYSLTAGQGALALTGQAATLAYSGAVDDPVVHYTNIVSGPNTGGEDNLGSYLTIIGRNFGASEGDVTVGGGSVATIYSWTDTRIAVRIGPSAATGAIVVERADAATATAPEDFTVRSGRFFYVSLTGNNGTGAVNDPSLPFRTPNYIFKNGTSGFMQPGDFVIMRGGEYILDSGSNGTANGVSFNSFVRANEFSGTDGYPLTWMAHNNEAVTVRLDAATYVFSNGSSDFYHDYVVSGFQIKINTLADNITAIGIGGLAPGAVNCDISGGALVDVAPRMDRIRVSEIDIDGQGAFGQYTSNPGANTFIVGHSADVKVYGVEIHDFTTSGDPSPSHIFYSGVTQRNVEYAYCKAYNIPKSRGVFQVAQDAAAGGACWGSLPTMQDITIRSCDIYNNGGQAFVIDGGTGTVLIQDCLIHSTPRADDHRYEDIISARGSADHLDLTIDRCTIKVDPGYAGTAGGIVGIGAVSGGYCPQSIIMTNNVLYLENGSEDDWTLANGACGLGMMSSSGNVFYGKVLPSWAGTGDVVQDPDLDAAYVSSIAGKGITR